MSTTQTRSSTQVPISEPRRSASPVALAVLLLVLAVLVTIAYNARQGAVSPRIANPAATGVPPRPVEFLSGRSDTAWLVRHQVGCAVMMLLLTVACLRAWRRQPGHPYVLMVLAATAIVWQDPIMNWAPYAVYNPQLWHFPEDWPLVRMSPTVEPFVVIGYSTFYFLAPFFSSIWILRRLQARASSGSFVWRRPLISMALLLFVTGFTIDAALEIFCVHSGLYIYSQVIPWGSLFAGTTFQFPLIWESSLVTVVMIPAGVLCYRDDSGRTQAEKLAQRFRWSRTRPALTTFLVMAGILNLSYFIYGAGFAAIRASKLATSVACPYPFPEAKVYDPQGFYEREGQPGPYFEGHWSRWMTAQPDGRPTVNPVKEDGYCRPGNHA
ncbi:MAG TPA: spirocyclase AveC family protein [Candidatus Methylomirabilis sp.]|nr:spirocyclase AveC family protein [Candidatus Methylomirabilis sp.]